MPDLSTASIQPGKLFRASQPSVRFIERFTPQQANLQFLSCGEFHLPPLSASRTRSFPRQESLFFMWRGTAAVTVGGTSYLLVPYDVLYVPRDAEFSLSNPADEEARLWVASAPAAQPHPVFHAKFQEMSQREERIRRLPGKDVYLMFDVSEPADKLVAGYTFFRPFARSWPPHNHTDQEEAYIFIKGQGSMEVYENPETLTFVHNVGEGDIVSIPMMNYHPVFSQEEPLEFIWCIAGARYWVGDKSKDFMSGKASSVTT